MDATKSDATEATGHCLCEQGEDCLGDSEAQLFRHMEGDDEDEEGQSAQKIIMRTRLRKPSEIVICVIDFLIPGVGRKSCLPKPYRASHVGE